MDKPGDLELVAGAEDVLRRRLTGVDEEERPLVARAYRLGDPTSPLKAVVLGAIHGDGNGTWAVAIRCAEPSSTEPTGVPRPLEKQTDAVSASRP